LVEESTPDGGITEFYYDDLSRLRFSQDAQQKVEDTYAYIKYDNLSRITEAGESSWEGEDDFQSQTNEVQMPVASSYNADETYTHYSTPYDITFSDGEPQRNLENRVSYTQTVEGVYTFYSYDVHGNVAWTIQRLPGLPDQYIRYEYDLVSGNVLQAHINPGQQDQFHHRYSYDEDNRVTQVETSSDGVIWEQDASYDYYEHGFLRRAELGTDKVQGCDYVYTIQGWLKGMNNPMLGTNPAADPGDDGTAGSLFPVDVFGMKLHYYEGDFTRIGSAYANIPATFNSELTPTHQDGNYKGLYNGNIAAWHSATQPSKDPNLQYETQTGYIFRYDELQRIKSGTFYSRNLQASTQWAPQEGYNVAYSYDANGNLKTLQREKFRSPSEDPGFNLDNLQYHYYEGTNRLEYVDDLVEGLDPHSASDQSEGNYQYDEIGNLIRDHADSIEISWNVEGKVSRVDHSEGRWSLAFTYDASGNRILKHYELPLRGGETHNQYTWYVYGADDNLLSVYEKVDTTLNGQVVGLPSLPLQIEVPMYGSKRLGLFRPNIAAGLLADSSGLYARAYEKRSYEIADHLGNVRGVVSDSKDATYVGGSWAYTAELLSYHNYYPFGLEQPNRTYKGGGYRFGFQGQESDDEVLGSGNFISYKYRVHDPRIGRFFSLDPLAPDYPHNAPYAFSENRVIDAVELEGLEGVQYTEHFIGKDGTTVDFQIIKLDVYVAIDDDENSTNFKIGDLTYIKNALDNEFNGEMFLDSIGNEVYFDFNVVHFDASETSANKKKYSFDWITTPNGETVIRGAVLSRQAFEDPARQGLSWRMHSSISSTARDPSHTIAHEIAHQFYYYGDRNPITSNEHSMEGGIFQLRTTHAETGQVIQDVDKLSQENVNHILEVVPSIESRDIHMPFPLRLRRIEPMRAYDN